MCRRNTTEDETVLLPRNYSSSENPDTACEKHKSDQMVITLGKPLLLVTQLYSS